MQKQPPLLTLVQSRPEQGQGRGPGLRAARKRGHSAHSWWAGGWEGPPVGRVPQKEPGLGTADRSLTWACSPLDRFLVLFPGKWGWGDSVGMYLGKLKSNPRSHQVSGQVSGKLYSKNRQRGCLLGGPRRRTSHGVGCREIRLASRESQVSHSQW